MAKPDLQKTYVSTAGQGFRDDGKGSLTLALANLPRCASPAAAVASGIPIGGWYVLTTTSGLAVRLA